MPPALHRSKKTVLFLLQA